MLIIVLLLRRKKRNEFQLTGIKWRLVNRLTPFNQHLNYLALHPLERIILILHKK